MTFWLDAHLDPKLVGWLSSQFGVIAKTLSEIDLRDATDVELFAAARRWLRIRNERTAAIQAVLRKAFPDALKLLGAGEALVEITEDIGN